MERFEEIIEDTKSGPCGKRGFKRSQEVRLFRNQRRIRENSVVKEARGSVRLEKSKGKVIELKGDKRGSRTQ